MYGDSVGIPTGFCCRYGMGMGIEIQSPRQPCLPVHRQRRVERMTPSSFTVSWKGRYGCCVNHANAARYWNRLPLSRCAKKNCFGVDCRGWEVVHFPGTRERHLRTSIMTRRPCRHWVKQPWRAAHRRQIGDSAGSTSYAATTSPTGETMANSNGTSTLPCGTAVTRRAVRWPRLMSVYAATYCFRSETNAWSQSRALLLSPTSSPQARSRRIVVDSIISNAAKMPKDRRTDDSRSPAAVTMTTLSRAVSVQCPTRYADWNSLKFPVVKHMRPRRRSTSLSSIFEIVLEFVIGL